MGRVITPVSGRREGSGHAIGCRQTNPEETAAHRDRLAASCTVAVSRISSALHCSSAALLSSAW